MSAVRRLALINCGVALLACAVAVFADLYRGSGIDNTPGAVLVIVSAALLAAAEAVLALALAAPRWLRAILLALCGLDLVGTAAAAALLHQWALLILMGLGLLAWLLQLVRPGQPAAAAA